MALKIQTFSNVSKVSLAVTDHPLIVEVSNGTATTPSTPTPTPVEPQPVATKIKVGTTQVETMTLDKYTVGSVAAATGGVAVENRHVSGTKATAKSVFDGEAGTYKMRVEYFDENDGVSQFGVKVNGNLVKSWVADKSLGSAGAVASTLAFQEFDANLKAGDLVEVYGVIGAGEHARLDDITLTKIQVSTPTTSTTPSTNPAVKTINGTSGNDRILGTDDAEVINGLGGSDMIYGGGGNDILTGGTGSDYFTFKGAPLNATTNVDVVKDFDPVYDIVRMHDGLFTKLTTEGNLQSGWFRAGTKALDSNDYVIYDQSTGKLYYDADGSGSKAAVQFAMIENRVKLTAADFIVL